MKKTEAVFPNIRLVAPQVGADAIIDFCRTKSGESITARALRIRAVEEELFALFGRGILHGTIHTCVGQEFIGAMIGALLRKGDVVTSNHRGHGHYIGATDDWRGLIDEVLGNADGPCGGVGGSQHLFAENFISNGQQGGLLPVACGLALARQFQQTQTIVVSFIGEGTLGEGVVYEAMNMSALWTLPHLIICENNGYSQSTPQDFALAGQISTRATAFGWRFVDASYWNLNDLLGKLKSTVTELRSGSPPVFVNIKTYRLAPHSRGDDLRDKEEVAAFRAIDPINIILASDNSLADAYGQMREEVSLYATNSLEKAPLTAEAYLSERGSLEVTLGSEIPIQSGKYFGDQLRELYRAWISRDKKMLFLGEDIADPYGGAFKITRGIGAEFPQQLISTPISEAGIVGVGIGLALSGYKPFVEIMFGDFLMLAMDQLVNNASKFHHMFGKKVYCPLVIRTPMGGRRGYGPTHSQSLERLFLGIDNCLVLSLNSLVSPARLLSKLVVADHPVLLFENKGDYSKTIFDVPPGFSLRLSDGPFPTIVVEPTNDIAEITLVSYGGMARIVADNLREIFEKTDLIPVLIVPSNIHPIDIREIAKSLGITKRMAIVEEGPSFASVGAEILALIAEAGCSQHLSKVIRIGAHGIPVPTTPTLEQAVLPDVNRICAAINALGGDR